MSVLYSRQSSDQYTVWRNGSHRIGVVQKMRFRWWAVTPAGRILGSFASMSGAGNKLVEENNKKTSMTPGGKK